MCFALEEQGDTELLGILDAAEARGEKENGVRWVPVPKWSRDPRAISRNVQHWYASDGLFHWPYRLRLLRVAPDAPRMMPKVAGRVSTEGHRGGTERFVGTASPEDLRWSLVKPYPWLESAYARAR
jgi:hypothetical protein